MFINPRKLVFIVVSGSVTVALLGCNVDGRWMRLGAVTQSHASADRNGNGDAVDISVVESREVDLVETMLAHRTRYREVLQQLHGYYEGHGEATKAEWAAFELSGLRKVRQFRYLLDAEIPSDELRPEEEVAEADQMYEDGLALMRSGGHGVPGIYRQDRMIEAARTFREMIERYPSSDRIADAAFLCGEIHKEYLPGQEIIAVKWYERVWKWDPDTAHPARFQAAVVYDYRLHDRDRALELYQGVLQYESGHKGNARFAIRRIRELTGADERTARAE